MLGAAPHSLRATTPDQIAALAAALPEGPLHIHAAEQIAEVAQVEAWLGARPVEVLLDRVGIGPRWCLVHATHMTPDETGRLARSGAVAGLCPITEADLGDGVFHGAGLPGGGRRARHRLGLQHAHRARRASSARWNTASGCATGAQRARAAPAPRSGRRSTGGALAGGARALGRDAGAIRAGALADLVAIDREDVALAPLDPEQLLDGWIFAAGDRVVREVWSAGRHVVREGRHVARDAVEARYRRAVAATLARM